MVGIKETQDLAIGILDLAGIIAVELKKGVSASALVQIIEKSAASEKIKAAYVGISEVASEVQDINLKEAGQLVGALIPEVIELIEKIQATPAVVEA